MRIINFIYVYVYIMQYRLWEKNYLHVDEATMLDLEAAHGVESLLHFQADVNPQGLNKKNIYITLGINRYIKM